MASSPTANSWFAVPAPIRELFKLFPLHLLPPEPLPARAPLPLRPLSSSSSSSSASEPQLHPRPRLYVFSASEDDARAGSPSFNPSCLKWQTYLSIAGVDVDLVPSNNHASPSGALPFLLPPPSSSASASPPSGVKPQPPPLMGERIGRYARDNASSIDIAHDPPLPSSRVQAYEALLTQNLRPAWLYTLYLLPANLPLLTALYLPQSPLLRLPLLHSLRAAASAEILKTTRRPSISPPQLLADAAAALRALSALLAGHEWFFAAPAPGLFDADVFAYTHLILDEALGWRDDSLARCLAEFDNLVHHRNRLYQKCWPEQQQRQQQQQQKRQ